MKHGVWVSLVIAVLINLMLQNSWHDPLIVGLLPDWLFLVFLFWGMRLSGLWFVWVAWWVGCAHSLVVDEFLGFYSFIYACLVLIVQNARLRLLVVSKLENGLFVSVLIAAYLLLSDLAFRFESNSLQFELLIAFAGNIVGWWLVNMCLQRSYPLVREQDLFSPS